MLCIYVLLQICVSQTLTSTAYHLYYYLFNIFLYLLIILFHQEILVVYLYTKLEATLKI